MSGAPQLAALLEPFPLLAGAPLRFERDRGNAIGLRSRTTVSVLLALVGAGLWAAGAAGYSVFDLLSRLITASGPSPAGVSPNWQEIVGIVLFAAGAGFALYDRQLEVLKLTQRLAANTPHLVLQEITQPIPFGDPTFGYEVLSLRFQNDPLVANEASIALTVGAEVALFNLNNELVFGPRIGQWVDESQSLSALDHGPLSGTLKTVSIAHGPTPTKLPLIVDVRVPNDRGWFLFEGDGYIGRSHLKFSRGEYRLRVRLSGWNLKRGDADFWFHLVPNAGNQPTLTPIVDPAKRRGGNPN